ncbi:4a-hydroxytetrahydrobiopterin dehydratase [Pontiellaceae bacterium B1224]|nr:4a-hydroxytetrahydrobiopterin dehydratase [Pontiellaceae bacterium B1224]
MTENLNQKKCKPCETGAAPLAGSELENLINQLPDGWQVVDRHHLKKEFGFDDFRQALDFTNRVGEIAEEEGHHPTICLTWGKVEISIWTHKVNGLTENDFILAAKADQL